MAIGLTDHVWSYREYIWLPVHTDPVLTVQMEERIARLLTPALQGQPRGRTQAPPPIETRAEHDKRQPLCHKRREEPVIVLQDYPLMGLSKN
jgi:hypothetical protein